MLDVLDSTVEPALLKSALRPAILKTGKILLRVSEVVARVVIYIRIPINSAQVIQSPINRRGVPIISPVSVTTAILISVAIAISIPLVIRTLTVWTVDLRIAC